MDAARTKTAAETRADALARGRARKSANALAAVLAGGLLAMIFSFTRPPDFKIWALAFAAGLFWANGL